MYIGTAAPSISELKAAKHHFIHHKTIKDNYNVGAFEKDALHLLKALFKTQDVVIMVGGSGLYVDAVTHGLNDFPEVDKKIRETLNTDLQTKGLEYLQDQLKILDPKTYNIIALENPHRVIRALEICLGTKKPYSSFLNKVKEKRDFKTISVGLTADRDIIYNRINKRVDLMMASGLLNEVEQLVDYQNLNALKTVGYKEIFNYLNGEWTLEFAVSEIKKNTRRFAKRQLTWFKRNNNILWFNYAIHSNDIIKQLETLIK